MNDREDVIVVRDADQYDAGNIRDILWTTWLDTYASFIPIEDLHTYFGGQYDISKVEELLANPDNHCFVGEVGKEAAAAMITRFRREEQKFSVSSLYVLPQYQGFGLGRMLLTKAEVVARGLGMKELWLGVMVQNTRAVSWYEKAGFRFEMREPFTMGNTIVEHLIGRLTFHTGHS